MFRKLRSTLSRSPKHNVQPADDDGDDSLEDAVVPVVRRLSALAEGPRLAPTLSGGALPSSSPPSFLVNLASAAAAPPTAAASASPFAGTPQLVRLTSSSTRSASASLSAAAVGRPALLSPADSAVLPPQRRLVWTQSRSLREATLLEQAKILAMCGVREDEEAVAVAATAATTATTAEAAEEAPLPGCDKPDDVGNHEAPEDETNGLDEDNACGPFGSPEDRRRLKRRLERLGLTQLHCEGDGSCLFRAVSAQLFGGDQHHHKAVRAAVVAHMLEHRDDYEAFLGESFAEYLTSMSTDGVWGDELCLRAVSDALGVVVHVVSSDEQGWYHLYVPDQQRQQRQQQQPSEQQQQQPPSSSAPTPHLFLAYVAPVHYDGLAPAAAAAKIT
jgi:hypothetical protein